MPMKRSSEIKVGLFAILAMVLFLVSVMVLTSKSSFFRESIVIHTSFQNIGGLIEGSEVRISGVLIGFVKTISFAPEEGATTVLVDMTVDDRGMDRVMKDSKATIGSLGLLGKKYIEIMPGLKEAGTVQDGDFIVGVDPASLSDALDKGGKIMDSIGATATHLEVLFASIAGKGDTETDLSRTISTIKRIVGRVETGDGVLHTLIYDPSKRKLVDVFAVSAAHIRAMITDVHEGSGTLHELIYGDQYKQLMTNLADTSEALRAIVVDLRTKPGVLHALIYDEEQLKLLEHIVDTTDNLARITERIERGEGTIGGLIVDPSIYEDLKKLPGEVERNRVVKTYIRYVVRKREEDLEKREQPPDNPPAQETPEPEE